MEESLDDSPGHHSTTTEKDPADDEVEERSLNIEVVPRAAQIAHSDPPEMVDAMSETCRKKFITFPSDCFIFNNDEWLGHVFSIIIMQWLFIHLIVIFSVHMFASFLWFDSRHLLGSWWKCPKNGGKFGWFSGPPFYHHGERSCWWRSWREIFEHWSGSESSPNSTFRPTRNGWCNERNLSEEVYYFSVRLFHF